MKILFTGFDPFGGATINPAYEAVKLLPFDVSEWIPVVCGFVGGCLGVVALHVIPDFPATDYLTAIAVGIVSGFAATGVHQVYRQLYPAEGDDAWM